MQYFLPADNHFVGDCMPFAHDGVFHLFYLLDEGHHQALGGLGGHQWAHAATTDLIHWTHYPLALAITRPEEGSICTGSMMAQGGRIHAFYATRYPDWRQVLGHAVSSDGIHFVKDERPLAAPPVGYAPNDYRDPFAWQRPDGRYELLITAQQDPYPLTGRGGCLVRMTSDNLTDWQFEGPALIPGGEPGHVPECPDLFHWNGWYYLVFGQGLQTHYRMARTPGGPWQRPVNDLLGSALLSVMKTAAFGPQRRIGAGWLPCRDKQGHTQWGGNLVLREIIQQADGTLGTAFPAELTPPLTPLTGVQAAAFTPEVSLNPAAALPITLDSPDSLAAAALDGLPADFSLALTVTPNADFHSCGLTLRGQDGLTGGVPLTLTAHPPRATLGKETIDLPFSLNRPFTLQIVAHGDIFDVCIDHQATLINRLPGLTGTRLWVWVQNGGITLAETA